MRLRWFLRPPEEIVQIYDDPFVDWTPPLDRIFTFITWLGYELYVIVRATRHSFMPLKRRNMSEWLIDITAPPNSSADWLGEMVDKALTQNLGLVIRRVPLDREDWTRLAWQMVPLLCSSERLHAKYIQACNERTSSWRWAGVRPMTEREVNSSGCAGSFAGFCRQVQSAGAPSLALFGYSVSRLCWPLHVEIRKMAFYKAFNAPDINTARQSPHQNASLKFRSALKNASLKIRQQHRLGRGFPRLYLHPKGAMSTAHIDSRSSYFWVWLMRGVKRVRVWPLDTYDVRGSAEGRFGDRHFGYGTRDPFVEHSYHEFTLNPGDFWYAPPNMFHAVVTIKPSMMLSANYFPK